MKKILIITLIVVLMGLAIFKFTGNSVKDNEEIKEFNVKAFRFGYSPDVIEVNKGDKVRINIENTDTLHGIRIPDFGIKGNENLEFEANKSGEFTWYCTNMCGSQHKEMQGRLIVK